MGGRAARRVAVPPVHRPHRAHFPFVVIRFGLSGRPSGLANTHRSSRQSWRAAARSASACPVGSQQFD